MSCTIRVGVVVLAAVLLAGATVEAQPGGQLTGRVTDGSGGALPGVTVTVSSDRLKRPVVVVSDHVGQYQTPPLPADTYAVTFEMSGFETRTNPAVLVRPGEIFVLDRQLGLASLTETVTVTGEEPKAPPAPPRKPLRTTPATTPIPKPLLASVCGPDKPEDLELIVGHIIAHRDDARRELYGPGDVLLLDVGSDMGMAVGQNFVVRRRFRYGDKGAPAKLATYGGQSAGVVQVVSTTPETAVVAVVYGCGEFEAGDAIAPFDPMPVVAEQAGGDPDYDDPASIVFGDLGRATGTAHQLMVIDRGLNQDVVRGQRVTIFRRTVSGGPVVSLADGLVVAVRPQSATIRIDRATDAIESGALVALHR
jgi:hypothetical protein